MYAAILHLSFPPERHAEVVRFLDQEMLAVIRANAGFVDFRVFDGGEPGRLVMIDTWERAEDSAAAGGTDAALAVHARFADLDLTVAGASRYQVVVQP